MGSAFEPRSSGSFPVALIDSVGRLRWEAVPLETRNHTAAVFADTVGVIMAGARSAEIRRFVTGGGTLFSSVADGQSQILDTGLTRTDPMTAAFVNGTAGTFLELDEGYRPTGHPAVQVVPAALAAAQACHATGAELLAAVLGGYEVTARLFEAYELTYPLHPHGHFGAIGAAVAVAKLLRAEPRVPAAIAATLQLLPVWEACFEGATARNAWTGSAAAVGITANRMAMAGFTGSFHSTAIAFGELAGRQRNPDALSRSLDSEHFAIMDDYLKLHSACALSHAALDAVLLMPPIDVGSIRSVLVETGSNSLKLDRRALLNSLSTRFSLQYAVAAALVFRSTKPWVFEPDDRTVMLAERVTVRWADSFDTDWPHTAPARVTVTTSMSAHTVEVDNPVGHHANPASAAALRQKFGELCGRADWPALYDRLLDVAALNDCFGMFPATG
jgi:2-methylcitrate dehydratase PrpD